MATPIFIKTRYLEFYFQYTEYIYDLKVNQNKLHYVHKHWTGILNKNCNLMNLFNFVSKWNWINLFKHRCSPIQLLSILTVKQENKIIVFRYVNCKYKFKINLQFIMSFFFRQIAYNRIFPSKFKFKSLQKKYNQYELSTF